MSHFRDGLIYPSFNLSGNERGNAAAAGLNGAQDLESTG